MAVDARPGTHPLLLLVGNEGECMQLLYCRLETKFRSYNEDSYAKLVPSHPPMAHNSTVCWGRALLCSTTEEEVSSGLTCKAWYRCEGASDYIIRWRCQAEDDEASQGIDTHFQLCNSSSGSAIDSYACPAPVVCPNSLQRSDEVQPRIVTDSSTDVILAAVLGAFALLAIMMMVVSTCKYWKVKKRLQLRLFPKTSSRTFPHALRHYTTWWGLDSTPYEGQKMAGKAGACQGFPYTDVYIPHEATQESFPHQHHVMSDMSRDEAFHDARKLRSAHIQQGHFSFDQRFGDPSVITGSFVYQPNARAREESPHSDHTSYSASKRYKKMENDESASPFWYRKAFQSHDAAHQLHKASLSEFYFHALGANDNAAKSPRFQHRPDKDAKTDFTRQPQISSIPIPTYDEMDGLHYGAPFFSPFAQSNRGNAHYNTNAKRGLNEGKCRNRSGVAGHIRVHNSRVDATSGSHHQSRHQDHSGVPGASHALRASSPDLISSHNFSNHAKNAPKARTVINDGIADVTADYDTSKDITAASLHYDGSTSNNSDNSSDECGQKFIATSHERKLSSELSYDSFRNEHLRDLARQGPSSSSTLDTGFRYLMASHFNSSAVHNQQ